MRRSRRTREQDALPLFAAAPDTSPDDVVAPVPALLSPHDALATPAIRPAPAPETQPDDVDEARPEPVAEPDATPARRRFKVEVLRSSKRRKTVQAQLVGDTIRVHVPARMSKADEAKYVAELVERLERRAHVDHVSLADRARQLARRHGLPEPSSIRWVDNQNARWGSCTIDTRAIRISSRLAAYPPWVLDYVIVHELAHLVHADHSAAFHALVDRYPRAERARGFLIAKGLGDDD